MIPAFVASLIFFIPAFIANPSAVITGGHLIIDGGRSWGGKRIFGDHKTWSGFLGGVATGALAGVIINYIFLFSGIKEIVYSSYFPSLLSMVVSLSFFSMLGDLLGSFVKRRTGKESGAESLLLDSYPFALSSLFFFYLLFFKVAILMFPWQGVIAILIVTPLIHRGVNIVGHRLKVKEVPY